MTPPPLTPPGRYRVLDPRGRLEGVLVVELVRSPWGALVHVCRWAGQASERQVPAAELARMRLEPARWP